jgi:hypothetical protein
MLIETLRSLPERRCYRRFGKLGQSDVCEQCMGEPRNCRNRGACQRSIMGTVIIPFSHWAGISQEFNQPAISKTCQLLAYALL